jgi:hypothetical protein
MESGDGRIRGEARLGWMTGDSSGLALEGARGASSSRTVVGISHSRAAGQAEQVAEGTDSSKHARRPSDSSSLHEPGGLPLGGAAGASLPTASSLQPRATGCGSSRARCARTTPLSRCLARRPPMVPWGIGAGGVESERIVTWAPEGRPCVWDLLARRPRQSLTSSAPA